MPFFKKVEDNFSNSPESSHGPAFNATFQRLLGLILTSKRERLIESMEMVPSMVIWNSSDRMVRQLLPKVAPDTIV